MINIFEKTNEMKEEGYSELNAQAKLCQDIVLDALSKSDFTKTPFIMHITSAFIAITVRKQMSVGRLFFAALSVLLASPATRPAGTLKKSAVKSF